MGSLNSNIKVSSNGSRIVLSLALAGPYPWLAAIMSALTIANHSPAANLRQH
jgi:hypothetical protein